VARTEASFCNVFEKNQQKKPGFLDLAFSDLDLDPHVDGYQCGNTTRVKKKKPWPGYMKLNIYKFSYHISMDS
jgi:hypothetical protein